MSNFSEISGIEQRFIRNFSIIAHIDHGKSTVSDRIIQICGGLQQREMAEQVLDSMELERERGITIKSQSVSLRYEKDGQVYQLNLIDTPGHVDFSYEVSRSLAACEGALLLIDASQGVQAQTVATCYTAMELGLEVLPVLNKIDLPTAAPEEVAQQVRSIIGLDTEDAIHCSGKSGCGIEGLLSQVIEKIPIPQGDRQSPLKALIIDSWFDNYLGVISLVRIKDGILKRGERVKIMGLEREYGVDCMGIFTPKREFIDQLSAGEVGWISYAMKDILGAPVGATLTHAHRSAQTPLPGFKKISPQVYAGLFPVETEEYENFRKALEKLSLNDASLTFEPENSSALGLGFRCGFLGLLHMEIVQERLEREYNLDLIATAPTVVYKVITKEETLLVETPSKLPATTAIEEIQEPIVECHILTPQEYLGKILQICSERRGKQLDLSYHHQQVSIAYELPMNEVIIDFFDQLKSVSRGYASLEYNFKFFQPADIVKLDILINGERIDALASLVHRSHVASRGRKIVEYLSQVISRQQFDLAIQAAIGNQILARSTVKQYRKNVTGKCYGGDITRKRKLLEKQKAGKKRMKMLGKVEVPKSAFLSLLNLKTRPSNE